MKTIQIKGRFQKDVDKRVKSSIKRAKKNHALFVTFYL